MQTRMAASASALILPLLACSDSPAGLAPEAVAGRYMATTLTTTSGGTVTDGLAAGASLVVRLRADGTTGGVLVVPGDLAPSGEFERHDLEGTWRLRDDAVTFDHDADTFLREMALRVVGRRLEGGMAFVGPTIRVVLSRR